MFRNTLSRLLKKGIRHAERSDASAVSSEKQTKQILRFAQDDIVQGIFQQPSSTPAGRERRPSRGAVSNKVLSSFFLMS